MLRYIKDFVEIILYNILRPIFLPFTLLFSFIRTIYNIVFLLQITMSDACVSVVGDTYYCNILNPSYVFTSITSNFIIWTIAAYICLSLYEIYLNYNR